VNTNHPNSFGARDTLRAGDRTYAYYRLDALAAAGYDVATLPYSMKILLENLVRFEDGRSVKKADIEAIAGWNPAAPVTSEIAYRPARVLLQDFTGVPCVVDLAAMRDALATMGGDPKRINPLQPVELVIDHSVQVDHFGTPAAFEENADLEFARNGERYAFLKWGQQAFETFKVVPLGIGIVHQVNLEYLAKGVLSATFDGETVYYPDTLVGTDSHTTMINGLGIVGWGVGGIEAEAGMLGQPVYFLTPEVVGVHMTGALREGVTATDLALHVTEMLRKQKVVGKFVEFYGPGASSLSLPDRATIANMAPEYGATMGYFPVDAESVNYLKATGRTPEQLEVFETYFKAQQLFGIPTKEDGILYSTDLELNLADVAPSVAGPKRPQDRIKLPELKEKFLTSLDKPVKENGFDKKDARNAHALVTLNGKTPKTEVDLKHGSVLIAAITSCTNTSNPSVMIAAGLVAKKAVERGLTVNPAVKTSLAPGSRVVADYFDKTGLTPYLDKLGFQIVGYGCTTCIGNSGPLNPIIDEAITKSDLVAASVLSGNRNFEARVHPSIKANFLMSPPLVVAFALAGRVDIDLDHEPLGTDKDGQPVYLKEIWPTTAEVQELAKSSIMPEVFRKNYTNFAAQNPAWNNIHGTTGETYGWDEKSTYIQEPPFFEDFSLEPGHITEIVGARPLGIFGDSVTTDHISPAGSFKDSSPAGKYLIANGVTKDEFNSYGSRRGNDRVMTRGTFANVRIKNLMVPGTEGGVTKYYPGGEQLSIYDASMKYQKEGTPLVIIAGQEYGTGSSRDWAAKGTRLLGVKAVIAQSFERIHRSNLVGMGVLPLCFEDGTNAATLKLDGTETYSLKGLSDAIKPRQKVNLEIKRADGTVDNVPLVLRIDTPIEVDYYQHGGILPYVLRQIVKKAA